MANEDAIRNIVREIVRQALTELNVEALSEIPRPPSAYYAPWTGVEYEAHPSRQQFDIHEAAIQQAICSNSSNRNSAQSKRTRPVTIVECAEIWVFRAVFKWRYGLSGISLQPGISLTTDKYRPT